MRPPNHGENLMLAAIFALTALGCVYGGLANLGDPAWMATGFAIAVLVGLVAWRFYRSVRPPRLRGVELRVEPERAAPSDSIAVALEPSRPRRDTVRVGLRGSAIVNAAVPGQLGYRRERRDVFHEEWRDVPLDSPQRLGFALPASAAATRADRNVRIGWEVVAQRPARLRADPRLVREVVVAPRGS